MIELIRVDNRLLHGQVSTTWTGSLGADLILLVSDTIKNDSIRLKATKLAKPAGIKVVVKTTAEAITNLESGVTDKYKMFIVCETILIASKIIKHTNVRKLNLGNTPFEDGKTALGKSVYISAAEKETLNDLIKQGYEVYMQMIPNDGKVSISSKNLS